MKYLNTSIPQYLILFFLILGSSYVSEAQNCPVPTDPGYDSDMRNTYELMNIPCAWNHSFGSSNIIVGFVDANFDDLHPDIDGKVVSVFGNCTSTSPSAGATHGTQQMGAVAALHNENCIPGIGGDTKVMGYCGGPTISTIQTLVDAGADIISISYSGIGSATGTAGHAKIREWTNQGITC